MSVTNRYSETTKHSPRKELLWYLSIIGLALLFGAISIGTPLAIMPWGVPWLFPEPSLPPSFRLQAFLYGWEWGTLLFGGSFLLGTFIAKVQSWLTALFFKPKDIQILEINSSVSRCISLCLDALAVSDMEITKLQSGIGIIEARACKSDLFVRMEVEGIEPASSLVTIKAGYSAEFSDNTVYEGGCILRRKQRLTERLANTLQNTVESADSSSELLPCPDIVPKLKESRVIPIALVSTCAITLFLVTLCFQLSNHFDVQVRACRFFLDHNDKKSALTLARSCVEQQPLNPLGWQLQSFCRTN